MKKKDINEIKDVKNIEEINTDNTKALDDARRVRVISPMMLVTKRFFRNKLAIIGLVTLILMFAFCFLGPLFYPYEEDDVFKINKSILFTYSESKEITTEEYYYLVDDSKITSDDKISFLSNVSLMKQNNLDSKTIDDYYSITKNKGMFYLNYSGDTVLATYQTGKKIGTYSYSKANNSRVLSFSTSEYTTTEKQLIQQALGSSTLNLNTEVTVYDEYEIDVIGKFKLYCGTGLTSKGDLYVIYDEPILSTKVSYIDDSLESTFKSNLDKSSFSYNEVSYSVSKTSSAVDTYEVKQYESYVAGVACKYLFDRCDLSDNKNVTNNNLDNSLCAYAFEAYGNDRTSFDYKGDTYSINTVDDEVVLSLNGTNVAILTNISSRRYNGENTIDISIKNQMETIINYMLENNLSEYSTTILSEKYQLVTDSEGNESLEQVLDENNNPVYDNEDFYVSRKISSDPVFIFKNYQEKYVADIYAAPSKDHLLGLDGNAMDVLARVMYGGRISLVIGFIVVFFEMIIGMILGGLAGYLGGIVDNIIMRIVDIMYCIPSMPILIIFGAMFDNINMPNIQRVIWMMVIIGIFGWPGIARLVRGQILSLREQEFMIACESSGLSTRRRIFKHLIPNVMPQLIVNATMGLGGVIITESTLSFLGLGVKFPMATWGQIINSVSTITDMVKYTYIWIPTGCLICLTVIAFNFVGDGLRDAYDPKMKR